MTIDKSLDLISQALQDDPSRRQRLFEILETGEFITAIARLADELGEPIPEADLMEALRQGRREWAERDVP